MWSSLWSGEELHYLLDVEDGHREQYLGRDAAAPCVAGMLHAAPVLRITEDPLNRPTDPHCLVDAFGPMFVEVDAVVDDLCPAAGSKATLTQRAALAIDRAEAVERAATPYQAGPSTTRTTGSSIRPWLTASA